VEATLALPSEPPKKVTDGTIQSMWPRKQLDIGWTDLAFGLMQFFASREPPSAESIVGADWISAEEALVCLSVRSGWDLLLTALDLPRGSEVIVSAVTIPDMIRIIEHHGLVPVPVDVEAEQLRPSIDQLERSITPRTRAILVAHLFGTRLDMSPIIDMARQHELLVIEDCAQAFVGNEYAGHSDSDCALFSFGPIKTATALGGAVVRVPNDEIRARMEQAQGNYPCQSCWSYFRRLVKYVGFRLLAKRFNYAAMVRLLTTMGIDYDQALGNAAHSFSGGDFFAQIRRRPCRPLVQMLRHRISTFSDGGRQRLYRRTDRGDQLAVALPDGMVAGSRNPTHTYWVMPLRVANGDEVIAALRAIGFDATARSSLIVVPASTGPTPDDVPLAPWLNEIVFVPNGDDIPDQEWRRMMSILQKVAQSAPVQKSSELVALSGVSVSS
jgi:perosamine synthetase